MYIRDRVLSGEVLAGTWCNLGSSISAEIIAQAGFDWMLIDIEHGFGDYETLVHQLQAVTGTHTPPIVRIAWNEAPRFKRVLDLGPSGIMVPCVNTAEEARQAVASMRYPPAGIRGVAKLHRGTAFGRDFENYFTTANDTLLTVIQIETPTALENVEEIAAVDGVDVLFVGPLDLTANLGILQQFDHPKFRDALTRVATASRNAGKAAGMHLMGPGQIKEMVATGFTFIAAGSDRGMLAEGMRSLAEEFASVRR